MFNGNVKDEPLVSIIIPAYNSVEFIEDTVSSCLAQSYKNIEVIVIDDGSTDNTREELDKFSGNIKYIYQNNKGESVARNTGVSQSRGEYIVFLDADDILFPEMVEKGIEALTSDLKYHAAYGIIYSFNTQNNIQKEWMHTLRISGCIFGYIVKGLTLSPGQVILKRSCIQ